MPDMQTAIVNAGLPIKSMRQRCWQIIKDNGPQTIKSIAARMHIPHKSASNTISAMVQRGMVETIRHGSGAAAYRAVGSDYEDSKARSRPSRRPSPPPRTTPQAAPAAAPRTPTLGLPAALQNMTIAQLHQSYLALQKLFGSEA